MVNDSILPLGFKPTVTPNVALSSKIRRYYELSSILGPLVGPEREPQGGSIIKSMAEPIQVI